MNPSSTSGVPGHGDAEPGARLHLSVGPACNNNCVFCMEDNRAGRALHGSTLTDDDVRQMMTASSGTRELMFTSGEPTLNPRLPHYVRMARDLGFETIGLITNGRRLAYPEYARSLLQAGLNLVQVSIHGPDARVHDALTRSRGSFDQAVAGLRNLADLRDGFPGVRTCTSYVVNKRNFRLLRAFYDAMIPFRVHEHVFNTMMVEGRGRTAFRSLMPRYSEIVAEFADFVAGLPSEGGARVYLLDVPACVTEGLPDAVRGSVERNFSFERTGTSSMSEWDASVVASLPESDLHRREAIRGEHAEYTRLAKSLRDTLVRVKRPECGHCRHDATCVGIYARYAEAMGFDEFKPVPRP